MVYGNTGDQSGSGVAFTRDPATGEKVFYGEFLINAQGEDVVAGVRTPEPVDELANHLPEAYTELEEIRRTLENHFKDMQDFEFTIQNGKVYMLQTRNGKRTGVAAVRIAVEMVKEKLIDWKTAVARVPADQLDQVLAPIFDREAIKARQGHRERPARRPRRRLAAGSTSTPNAPSRPPAKGEKVLLVRIETSPEDLRGMIAAEGILTARGGVSSHAALVARQMGKVCVCGASALQVDYDAAHADGRGQDLHRGRLPLDRRHRAAKSTPARSRPPRPRSSRSCSHGARRREEEPHLQQLRPAHGLVRPGHEAEVRTNADKPDQAAYAIAFGATGIGLIRTEHMFFEGDRIDAMREMILADTQDAREARSPSSFPTSGPTSSASSRR